MIKVKQKIEITRGHAGRKQIQGADPARVPLPTGQVPRISKLMALAIRFEGLLQRGAVSDQSELARLAQVTQPRMTQIMNLLHLASDIQEELLMLPEVASGRAPIHEKLLRPVAAEVCWQKQREMWTRLRLSRTESRGPQANTELG